MSEVIVLDIHIWFWLMTQEFGRFPAHWRDAIETAQTVGVSAISCYEVTLAYQRGRLELPCPTYSMVPRSIRAIWDCAFSVGS